MAILKVDLSRFIVLETECDAPVACFVESPHLSVAKPKSSPRGGAGAKRLRGPANYGNSDAIRSTTESRSRSTSSFQKRRTRKPNASRSSVLTTVYLDHETLGDAGEVGDVRADGATDFQELPLWGSWREATEGARQLRQLGRNPLDH